MKRTVLYWNDPHLAVRLYARNFTRYSIDWIMNQPKDQSLQIFIREGIFSPAESFLIK